MVVEKAGSGPSKPVGDRCPQQQEPLGHAKKSKQQVSDGFTVKAMMKNTVGFNIRGCNSNFLNINRMLNHAVLSLSNSKQKDSLKLCNICSLTTGRLCFYMKKHKVKINHCIRYTFCGLPKIEKKLIAEDFDHEEYRVWNKYQ